MTIARFVCVLLALWVAQRTAASPDKTRAGSGPWSAGPTPDPHKPETWNFASRMTGGFVQAIDKSGIALYWPEHDVQRFRHDPLTGQLLEEKKIQSHPAVPPKKFLLVEELANGGYIRGAPSANTYRITDVRIGDRVAIEYCRRNGVDVCKTICISRRPGGQIPPAPGEKPNMFRKHHEQANADQDWEEKRVAYPRKYWPTYLGKDGKFYAGPYPSESLRILIKLTLAPMPREVKVGPDAVP